MKKLQFKTNLKCSGCIAAVKPVLDAKAGEGKWQVDLSDPQRLLTIEADIDADTLIASLAKVGYKAEQV
jgi:copper chaperone CopZ